MAVIRCMQIVVIFSLAIGVCHGFGFGVPESACVVMFPADHRTNASTMDPPVEIIVNQTTYQPGDVIEIQLNAKTNTRQPDNRPWFYEGAFLQVRTFDCAHQEAKGNFTVQDGEDFLQPVECFDLPNSAIRHYSHAHITQRTFYWHAPATAVGHVIVRGTVARNKELFWVNVYSEVISDPTDNTSTASLTKCPVRTQYDPYEFCPAGRDVSAAVTTTSGPVAFLLVAAVLFLQ